jgi:hypothetical protein
VISFCFGAQPGAQASPAATTVTGIQIRIGFMAEVLSRRRRAFEREVAGPCLK